MLSVFPIFLDYQLLAPLLLRVGLGLIVLFMARESLRKIGGGSGFFPKVSFSTMRSDAVVAWLELITGILLIIGLITQVAAIALIVFIVLRWRGRRMSFSAGQTPGQFATAPDSPSYEFFLYVMMIATSLSLLFLGAGFLAFDLPL